MDTLTAKELEEYLQPTYFIDSDHTDVVVFAKKHSKGATTDKEKAVKLYYAVRDEFRYDPYHVDLKAEGMKASVTLNRGSGYCGEKANLLAAVARAIGIPSRLHFCNVKNHLSTDKLIEMLRSDVFVFHGFTELYIDGKWVKATPAFNIELCEKFEVPPLEFDGKTDSIFQQYDGSGNTFMEYLHDYGTFAELPRQLFIDELKRHYPHLFEDSVEVNGEKIRWAD